MCGKVKGLMLMLVVFMTGCESGQETTQEPPSESNGREILSENSGCLNGAMAQFGQYLGSWQIKDSQLSQDGTTWSDGPGAQWEFVCLGNGVAIQDFWKPNGGPVGTNLRTFDSEKQTWEIVWVTKSAPGFSHIRAEQQPTGEIVMNYVSPIPNPLRRITFFPVESERWNWSLEFSSDGGDNWIEVYRIFATRSH